MSICLSILVTLVPTKCVPSKKPFSDSIISDNARTSFLSVCRLPRIPVVAGREGTFIARDNIDTGFLFYNRFLTFDVLG